MQNSVVQWLEKTARKFPNHTAYVDENQEYTWFELRCIAISIASNIERTMPGRKQPIAVYMEQSANMLAVYMGIAYSGNFYSPIDVNMPSSRAEKIVQTLRPKMFITSKNFKDRLNNKSVFGRAVTLCFEDIVNDEVDDVKAKEYADSVLDTDLLYVLFTSGSTGTPKGVAITHRSIIDLVDWEAEEYSITENDSFGNQSPFYFDNSVPGIFLSLKTGASLYVIPEVLFSQPVKLLQYLYDKKITTISWVPSAVVMVSALKALLRVDLSNTLKRVLLCGEVMPTKHLNVWRKYLPDVQYTNFYGPTEITYACTYYKVDRDFADDEPLPIGKPMRNTEILVLDNQNHLITEPEQVGELCVRGSSLAVGYYNNPEKTKEAFVQNPLQTAYEEKIYRTGDLVKYNNRRELMYVSRKDYQIKHLGNRIELGEIETAVSSLEGISMCCCLYNSKRSQIVLFLEKELSRAQVNLQLKEILPDYMLPGKVVCLDKIPLNFNGKIDRVKLQKEYID